MNSEAQINQHFVVFGSGSAGRRHARALRSLFPNARIQMVKRSSSVQPMHMLDGENIEIVHDVDAALTMHPDMVVVASPATLHARDVLATLPYCQNILVEKPLAQNLTDADLLLEALQKYSGSILVGYHLRFSETPRKLHELCSDGSLGEMLSASFGYGQHLSLWRKEIDARSSVTARADLGGGVLLELSHEIDAIDMLVGQLSSVKQAHITADALIADGIVDTAIDAELITASGVDVTLHLDMTSMVPWRSWQIRFAKGSLNANLLTGEIFRVDHDGVERLVFKASDDERDSAARSQISSFMSVNHSSSNLKQSHFVMMIIDAIRRSADAKESVVIVPRYGSM